MKLSAKPPWFKPLAFAYTPYEDSLPKEKFWITKILKNKNENVKGNPQRKKKKNNKKETKKRKEKRTIEIQNPINK